MEKFNNFISRFSGGGCYDLYTLEPLDDKSNSSSNLEVNYPYFEIYIGYLNLYVDNSEFFVRIEPNARYYKNVRLMFYDGDLVQVIGTKYLAIEKDMNNYILVNEKDVHEILRDIAKGVKPFIEYIQTARFIVNIPKSSSKIL